MLSLIEAFVGFFSRIMKQGIKLSWPRKLVHEYCVPGIPKLFYPKPEEI